MAGKVIEKGWVLPQPLGVALIVVLLGGILTVYWRTSDRIDSQGAAQTRALQDTHDLMIRLDQKLTDKNDHDKERFQQLENRFDSVDAWQQVTNKEIASLKIKTGGH